MTLPAPRDGQLVPRVVGGFLVALVLLFGLYPQLLLNTTDAAMLEVQRLFGAADALSTTLPMGVS